MGTPSSISVFDGKEWYGIYCNSDGYTTGVGAALLRLCPDYDNARKIVSKGHASMIADAKSLDDIEYYSERSKWDPKSKDETDCGTDVFDEIDDNPNSGSFDYYFKDGQWFMDSSFLSKLTPLVAVLARKHPDGKD